MEKAVEFKESKMGICKNNDALEFVLEDIRQALLCLEDLMVRLILRIYMAKFFKILYWKIGVS